MSHKRTRRKKLVSAVVLVTSAYASLSFAFGMVIGYLGMKYFYNRYIARTPLKFIYLDFKGWRIHLHHWLFGVLIVIFLLMVGGISELPKFLWGVICGIIAHDIYDFNDWHRVLARKKAT
jgi:hypothetical protein